MSKRDKAWREAIRHILVEVDPAGLDLDGGWFPEDEYDVEADRVMSLLIKGVSHQEVAATISNDIQLEWGVTVVSGKEAVLANAFSMLPDVLSRTRENPV